MSASMFWAEVPFAQFCIVPFFPEMCRWKTIWWCYMKELPLILKPFQCSVCLQSIGSIDLLIDEEQTLEVNGCDDSGEIGGQMLIIRDVAALQLWFTPHFVALFLFYSICTQSMGTSFISGKLLMINRWMLAAVGQYFTISTNQWLND